MKCAERTIQSYHLPVFVAVMDIKENVEKPWANYNGSIVQEFENRVGKSFAWGEIYSENSITALDILDYIYAVMFVPKYRKKYKNQLKIDFPRIPYPKDIEEFNAFRTKGSMLREIHSMEKEIDYSYIGYEVSESMTLDLPSHSNNEIRLNKQGMKILNVSDEIWNFGMGGYFPVQKWLKDRKGKSIFIEDINHIRDMVARIDKTIEIMCELDELF